MGHDWLDWIEEEARKRGEEAAQNDADPTYRERVERKRREAHERGVRLGWWDADGEPLPQPEDTDGEELDDDGDGGDGSDGDDESDDDI